tara:strand:+ start:395 stop:676 length:282 start_codon:yes stop_codon:yes gene_type:complete
MSILLEVLPLMNKEEKFNTNGEKPRDILSQIPCNDNPIALFVNRVINMAVLVIALFLAVKRNKGFELGSFLAACCCPLCYIAWAVGMGTKLTM